MKVVMAVTDHKGRVWGLGEVWMVWRAAPAGSGSLNGPSFHPSSALTRPSLATALSAHLPPTPPHGSWTVIHHSWTEDSGETRAATWNPHLVLASHPPTTEDATQFSFHQLPTMWDSVYVLGSGGHCSKMSGWRSWKSCWIFLQFYHSSLPLWTRIVLPTFSGLFPTRDQTRENIETIQPEKSINTKRGK